MEAELKLVVSCDLSIVVSAVCGKTQSSLVVSVNLTSPVAEWEVEKANLSMSLEHSSKVVIGWLSGTVSSRRN